MLRNNSSFLAPKTWSKHGAFSENTGSGDSTKGTQSTELNKEKNVREFNCHRTEVK